jgi:hypothetical protein
LCCQPLLVMLLVFTLQTRGSGSKGREGSAAVLLLLLPPISTAAQDLGTKDYPLPKL